MTGSKKHAKIDAPHSNVVVGNEDTNAQSSMPPTAAWSRRGEYFYGSTRIVAG